METIGRPHHVAYTSANASAVASAVLSGLAISVFPESGLRPGMRVRHAQFGVGTVVSVEEQNDDMKIKVRFNLVGVKKLLAKYAKLEPA